MLEEPMENLSEQLEGASDAVAIAQETELGQMKKRIEKLDALLVYFAQRISDDKTENELSLTELYDYSKLIQEQIDGVLMYQKVAKRWSEINKTHARELIEGAMASHRYLVNVLEEQCILLAQKIDNIDLTIKWRGSNRQNVYNDNHSSSGLMFNLEG